jgi:hypothetical protein
MPSIIPSYLYTFFASIIVGTLIITTCAIGVINVKTEAEKQQLSNIADYVATKCMKLVDSAPSDNFTLRSVLDVPPLIGNQRYWVQILNDSSRVMVKAGFGATPGSSEQWAYIPFALFASGIYVSGSGAVFLQYQSNITGSYLTFYGGN